MRKDPISSTMQRSIPCVEKPPCPISVNEILEEIRALEASSLNRKRGEAIRMLTPLLSFVERYSGVVDTMTQYQTNPSSLIWGGLKLVVLLARAPNSWWNKLLTMLQQLGSQLIVFREYEQLFCESEALKSALASTYMDIFLFLRAAKQEIEQQNAVRAMLCWSTSSFIGEFDETCSKLSLRLGNLGSLTALLHRKALHEDLQRQRDFRVQTSETLERISATLPPACINAIANQEIYTKLISWLSPVDVSTTYHRNLTKRTKGTCEWLFRHEFFNNWLKPEGKENVDATRWVYGNPGVGKSVLCASFIDHIETSLRDGFEDVNLAYFFFDHSNQESLYVLALYRTILAQLLGCSPSLVECIKPAMQSALKYGRNRMSWPDNPAGMLSQVLSASNRRTYIVVDGLDECEDLGQEFRSFLETIQANSSCLTLSFSRPHASIYEFSRLSPSMCISSDSIQSDIDTYLVHAVSQLPNLNLSACSEVVAALSRQSRGIFLLATMLVHELESATCLEDIDEVLEEQPKDLDILYGSIVQRAIGCSPRWMKLSRNLWMMLCCSPRPLFWSELREGLAMLSSGGATSKQDLARRIAYKSVVLKACPPLVEHDSQSDVFRIAHISMFQYLVSYTGPADDGRSVIDLGSGHCKMAKLCMQYLVMPGVCERVEIDPKNFAYTNYATAHWCHHLLNSKLDLELQSKAASFLASAERRRLSLARWLILDKSGFPLQSMLKAVRSVQRLLRSLKHMKEFEIDELEDMLEVLLILDSQRSDWGTGQRITSFERNILLRELAREYSMAGRVEEGVEKFKVVITRLKRDHGVEPEATSWLMSGLGLMYDQKGDIELAISTQLEALELQKATNTDSGADEVLVVNELGRLYRHNGELEKAEQMHLRALESLRSTLPETDPQVIWTLNTLARCYRRQGRLGDAIRLHGQSHQAQSRALGDEHPHTLWTQSDLAKCYRDSGQLDRAIALQAKVTKTREKVLGPLHNDTLWSFNDLALMYEISGKFREALSAHQQALDGQRRTLGATSSATLWSEEAVKKLEFEGGLGAIEVL